MVTNAVMVVGIVIKTNLVISIRAYDQRVRNRKCIQLQNYGIRVVDKGENCSQMMRIHEPRRECGFIPGEAQTQYDWPYHLTKICLI